MTRKERFAGIVDWFEKNVPIAETELHYGNPYQLLVAVILSAQCTDRRVNIVTPPLFERFPTPQIVTPPLFERFPTPQDLASASFDEVYPYVKSVSYPNSKTEHLIAMAQKLLADFGGEVPSDIDALMTLPGVGRKTANVIASVVYDKPVIAVDTHVFRVSHRLGLSNGKTPLEVERDLERHIPEHLRARSHHWLILHGRYTCTARAPPRPLHLHRPRPQMRRLRPYRLVPAVRRGTHKNTIARVRPRTKAGMEASAPKEPPVSQSDPWMTGVMRDGVPFPETAKPKTGPWK